MSSASMIDTFSMVACFGGVLFGAALVTWIYWGIAREWNAYFLLKNGGIPCTVIVDHAYTFPRVWLSYQNRLAPYYVRFQLDPKLMPENVEVTQRIGYEKYRVLRDGGKLTARYLPYNPKIARLWDLHEDSSVRNLLTVIAIIGFVVFPPLIVLFLVVYLLDRIWIVYSPR